MAHHALGQVWEVPGDLSVDESSRNDEFERTKEERDGLLDEENAYNLEKEKLEKTLVEKGVAIKAM